MNWQDKCLLKWRPTLPSDTLQYIEAVIKASKTFRVRSQQNTGMVSTEEIKVPFNHVERLSVHLSLAIIVKIFAYGRHC